MISIIKNMCIGNQKEVHQNINSNWQVVEIYYPHIRVPARKNIKNEQKCSVNNSKIFPRTEGNELPVKGFTKCSAQWMKINAYQGLSLQFHHTEGKKLAV